ncbi:MAG TPA: ferritin-like domain-containing protein, partial [Actinomycetota bacterium]|nr:ferritin-like domain-containing protein [Actinomycetota bacterium]
MAEKEIFNGEAVMSFENEHDRRNFLKWAGIVGVGSSLAVAGFSRGSVSAQAEDSDLEILNYALTLEYLEADFYNRGVDG